MITPEHEKTRRLEAIQRHLGNGGSIASAARELGCKPGTLSEWTRSSQGVSNSRDLAVQRVDPAVLAGMRAIGMESVPPGGWIKSHTPDENGLTYSFRNPKQDDTPEDVAERIRAALEGLTPAEPVIAPESVMADLCAVYPLMDAHVGMQAWGKETGGQDYDLTLAAQDMRQAFAKVLALTPAAEKAVLLIGGDYFHSDDTRAETPASKHKLDMDGRFHKVLDVGIAIIAETVERLLGKHTSVTIRALRGNHDPHSHLVLTFALAERYRMEPRVEVDKSPRDLFMLQWGKCAIFAHHGDKGKPQQMALYLSDVCPFWSDTRHRHYLVGHVHHDHAKDLGPLRYESLRAFCPPDAYAASMGYGGRRALQSMTFDRRDGLVLRALDPIER
jgi:hypothetical protein